jgi:hypothetical protein
MTLLLVRDEIELRGRNDQRDRVVWLDAARPPSSLQSRVVELPPDPPAVDGWLAIRRLGDEKVAGRTVKEALRYEDVSLWWFVHYWLVFGHGFSGWGERYRTLHRVLGAVARHPEPMVLLSARAADDLVARAVARKLGLGYRWSASPWARVAGRARLRWGAETLFRLRTAKLVVRGLLARRTGRNTLSARPPVDLVFNASSSTWDADRGADRVLGPLLEEAERRHLSVAGLHLDHRRSLGLDTLRTLDRRIVAWESLVTPRRVLRAMRRGRALAREFGGQFPGEVMGIPMAELLADRLPVLFRTRLADAILAIDTSAEALARLRPKCAYIVDAYDLWGRAIVVAARRAGIRSLEVQHGIIQRHHDGYLHLPGELAPDHGQQSPYSPIPDSVLVHGEISRDTLTVDYGFPPAAAVITGSPHVERIRRAGLDRRTVREKAGLAAERYIALYFGAPYHVYPIDGDHLQAFLECCREMPELMGVLRPHPGEYSSERYLKAAARAGVEAPLRRRENPFELIVAADVVIAHNSTTALDAMVLERPVIHINMSGGPDLFPFVEEAGALPATTQAELCAALRALRDPARRLEVARRHQPYANRYYAPREDPARAMVDEGFPNVVPVRG